MRGGLSRVPCSWFPTWASGPQKAHLFLQPFSSEIIGHFKVIVCTNSLKALVFATDNSKSADAVWWASTQSDIPESTVLTYIVLKYLYIEVKTAGMDSMSDIGLNFLPISTIVYDIWIHERALPFSSPHPWRCLCPCRCTFLCAFPYSWKMNMNMVMDMDMDIDKSMNINMNMNMN